MSSSVAVYVGFLFLALIIGFLIAEFMKKSKDQKIAVVKEWLIWAVACAESALGSGTGRLKLAQVYNKFLETFPQFSKVISFELFCRLVDEALEELQNLMNDNEAIRACF